MNMRMIAAIAALTAALSGCATPLHDTTAAQRLAVACEAWAGALDSLTVLREEGALSEAQIARVDALRDPVTRACALDAPTTAEDIGRVERSAAELAEIEEDAR